MPEENKYKNLSEEDKNKKENMEKIDIIISVKKRSKINRIPKKIWRIKKV